MSDTARTSEPLPRQQRDSLLRRAALPILVVAAIVTAIWWIERDGGGTSPTGERYGPVSLPESLRTTEFKIKAEAGALAPDFLLERLDTGEIRLSDFRGSPVVLNFWATWCAPCRKEMPQFVEAHDRHRDEGLVVIGLNLQEGKSLVRPFAEDYGIDFHIAVDRDGEVGDLYRTLGLPTTYFIDRDGVIRSVFTGPILEESGDTDVQDAIDASELNRRIAEIMTAAP